MKTLKEHILSTSDDQTIEDLLLLAFSFTRNEHLSTAEHDRAVAYECISDGPSLADFIVTTSEDATFDACERKILTVIASHMDVLCDELKLHRCDSLRIAQGADAILEVHLPGNDCGTSAHLDVNTVASCTADACRTYDSSRARRMVPAIIVSDFWALVFVAVCCIIAIVLPIYKVFIF